jgi:P27 family predicted phage terminase small subunit
MSNPKKPTNLKLLQGTYRGDRAALNEARPVIEIPDIPPHLCDEAKAEWARLAPELMRLGLLSRIDRGALAAYCEHYADWVEATRLCATGINPDGSKMDRKVIKTKDGNFIENPYFSIKKRSAELMYRFLIEFGMTPASRTKIEASPLPTDKPSNPFAISKQK